MSCRKRFFLQCFSVHDPEVRARTKKNKCKSKRSTVHHSTSRVAPNYDTTISVKEFDGVSDRSLLPDFSLSDHETGLAEEVADAEHSLERLKWMLRRPYILTEREEGAEHSLDRLKSMLAKPGRLEPIMEEAEEVVR